MVRPEDLAKFFENGLPNWIDKPPPEKPAEAKKPITIKLNPPKAVAGHVPVTAKLGVTGASRMYAFFKAASIAPVSQMGNPFTAEISQYSADDMLPLGKHPGVTSRAFARGQWMVVGDIAPGSIVKVFVGRVGEPTYGMYYYVVDDYAPVIQILHSEENLYIQGKFTKVNEDMYSELDLRKLPSRSNGLPVRIVEA